MYVIYTTNKHSDIISGDAILTLSDNIEKLDKVASTFPSVTKLGLGIWYATATEDLDMISELCNVAGSAYRFKIKGLQPK